MPGMVSPKGFGALSHRYSLFGLQLWPADPARMRAASAGVPGAPPMLSGTQGTDITLLGLLREAPRPGRQVFTWPGPFGNSRVSAPEV